MQQLYRVLPLTLLSHSSSLSLSLSLSLTKKKCSVEDDEAGQIPMAYVVKAVGSELTEDQVIHFVASQVCHGSNSVLFTQ